MFWYQNFQFRRILSNWDKVTSEISEKKRHVAKRLHGTRLCPQVGSESRWTTHMLPLHQQHKRVREIWKKAAEETLEFSLHHIIENGLKLEFSRSLYLKSCIMIILGTLEQLFFCKNLLISGETYPRTVYSRVCWNKTAKCGSFFFVGQCN